MSIGSILNNPYTTGAHMKSFELIDELFALGRFAPDADRHRQFIEAAHELCKKTQGMRALWECRWIVVALIFGIGFGAGAGFESWVNWKGI
jgi:hypothetical protein